jgi:RHS repeat-associated protein
VVWAATYDSFGNIQISVAEIESNLRFSGQYYDAETGLYYNWNRYYDPTTGRYLQTDSYHEGMNLYSYVFNNSINLSDPKGLHALNPINWIKSISERAFDRAFLLYQGGYNDLEVFSMTFILALADILPSGNFAEALTGIESVTGEHLSAGERWEKTYWGSIQTATIVWSAEIRISGSFSLEMPATSPGMTTVTHWTRTGEQKLMSNDWVMKGRPTVGNYLLSGVEQPGKYFISPGKYIVQQVPVGTLSAPMENAPEWLLRYKELIGQRKYIP